MLSVSVTSVNHQHASVVASQYQHVRSITRRLATNMSAEDQMVQSCPEASPMKWHQAHTTWFFETFVLRPYVSGYTSFCEDFRWLFNSYYNSLGGRIPEKRLRSCLSRPSLDQILAYRIYADHIVENFLSNQIAEDAM